MSSARHVSGLPRPRGIDRATQPDSQRERKRRQLNYRKYLSITGDLSLRGWLRLVLRLSRVARVYSSCPAAPASAEAPASPSPASKASRHRPPEGAAVVAGTLAATAGVCAGCGVTAGRGSAGATRAGAVGVVVIHRVGRGVRSRRLRTTCTRGQDELRRRVRTATKQQYVRARFHPAVSPEWYDNGAGP